MAERPQPHLTRWRELVTPPEDLPELAGWLDLLCNYIAGRAPSGSVRQPVVTGKLKAYAALAHDGAVALKDAEHHAAARARPQRFPAETAPLGSPAQPLPSSERLVTTAQAAALLGCSEQWVRRLATLGKIRGRRVARNVWEIDRPSVIAYDERRRHGHGSSAPPEGEGPGGRSRGGSAAA